MHNETAVLARRPASRELDPPEQRNRHTGLKYLGRATVALAAVAWLSSANAALISWDASFFNDAGLDMTEYGKFQSTINGALNYYSTTFESPNAITVKVDFRAGTTGLGTTSSFVDKVLYQDYRNALAATGTSADDATALGTLPNVAGNPVNGDTEIQTQLALLRALGFIQGDNGGATDATVILNVNLMTGMLDRSGPIVPTSYDLLQVALHEINEVLGFTSNLNGLMNGDPIPTGAIGAADLWRYQGSGTRSFSTVEAEAAYFSINGGVTNLANFNTTQGGDFQDFNGMPSASVQDAFSTPGIRLDNALAEETFIDVIGYNRINPVPLPAAVWLFGSALAGVGVFGRRKNAAS